MGQALTTRPKHRPPTPASDAAGRWLAGGAEPGLEEVLGDPIVALLSRSDHITVEATRSIAAAARTRLLARGR